MPAHSVSRSHRPRGDSRVVQRDRALARLSRLTTATAVAGVLGTVGFGGLAALNYRGTSTDAATQPDTAADVSGTDITTTTTTDQSTAAQATTPPSRSSVQLQPVNPPTRSTRRARVSTGGSG